MSEAIERHSPPGHMTELRRFLATHRDALIAMLDGLTLEQATSTPTVSALSLFGVVKHCAFVERRWVRGAIGRQLIPGIVPPEHREQEFRADPGEDIDWLRAFYAEIARENDVVLDAVTDPDAWSGRDGMTVRGVLLHLIEELAQHRGQADIVREAIDGRQDLD
jgi:uncharacterized damage-inducible protein DinB